MFSALDISTSALVAQRTRLNTIASNIANASTTHNEAGERVPYQPRYTVFKPDERHGTSLGAMGVRVESVEIEDVEPRWRYQPDHPDAVQSGPRQGYVAYPNIDMTREFVDALEASRAYEANLGVIEMTNGLGRETLKILA